MLSTRHFTLMLLLAFSWKSAMPQNVHLYHPLAMPVFGTNASWSDGRQVFTLHDLGILLQAEDMEEQAEWDRLVDRVGTSPVFVRALIEAVPTYASPSGEYDRYAVDHIRAALSYLVARGRLSDRDRRAAVQVFWELASHQEDNFRETAWSALANLGDSSDTERLLRLLRHGGIPLNYACPAFAAWGAKEAIPELEGILREIESKAALGDPRAKSDCEVVRKAIAKIPVNARRIAAGKPRDSDPRKTGSSQLRTATFWLGVGGCAVSLVVAACLFHRYLSRRAP